MANYLSQATSQVNLSNSVSQVKQGYVPLVSSALGTTSATQAVAVANTITQQAIDSAVKDSNNQTSERLYSVQPRSAAGLYNNAGYYDRGQIASIKLLNTNNALEGTNNTYNRYMASDINPADGAYEQLVGAHGGTGYDRFLLTDVQVAYSEKVQIMTTFGDNEVVYYFGKNPVVMNLSGLLVDSLENNWLTDFIQLYQTFMRGTQLAKNFEMLELVLPNMKVVGSILSLNHQQNSARDTDIPFSMQFYAKEIVMLPQPKLSYGPTNLSVNSSSVGIFASSGRSSQGGSLANVATPNVITVNGQKYTNTGGFSEPSWLSNPGVLSNSLGGLATSYTWFRNNISSPVVSVIASIAKIIQGVSQDLTAIVSAFTAPLNAVLSDVMSVAIQGTAIAEMVYNSAANIGHILAMPGINLRNTLSSLKNTAGMISRLPESVSDVFKRNVHYGRINGGAAILSSGNQGTNSKAAVLNSGAPYTPQNSFSI